MVCTIDCVQFLCHNKDRNYERVSSIRLELFDVRTFTPTTYAEALSQLPKARQAEITSAARQNSPQLRVAGETLARKMLSEESGIAPGEIVIKKEALGKPYAESLNIHFSISHNNPYAICATHDAPIGIDIQRADGVRELVLRRVCSPEEQQYVFSAPTGQGERFTRLWCMKEAYVKRLGSSIFIRDGFFCEFENGEPITEYEGFSFTFPPAPDGYIIAVCC